MGNNGWLDIQSCPIAEKPEEARPVLIWHVFQRVMVTDTRKARDNRFNVYWQEIPEGWIDAAIQPPTRRDADPQNCVIIRDKWGEIHMRGWHLVAEMTEGVFWMPPPGPPDDYQELREGAD